MSENCFILRDVTFGYEHAKPVFDNIELLIRAGEQVALVGRNGAGKTTLFHMFVGLLVPEKGSVEVLGRVRCCERDFLEVRRHVALLFQNSEDQLFSPTVVEDVAFGPLNLGKSPAEAMMLATEALARVGMTGYENRITHHLSAGEMKLVALAGLLSMNPSALLMDEPSSNLDAAARRRLVALLKSLKQTKIIATHDMELVVEVCERVLVLDRGRIVADGAPRSILSDEELMRNHGLEVPHIIRHMHPHA